MRESDIEDYLKERAEAMGGLVRKVQWVGRSGAPDRLLMLPIGRASTGRFSACPTIWVELKAPGKKPTEQQLREHALMREKGQVVVVIDSLNAVDELLS